MLHLQSRYLLTSVFFFLTACAHESGRSDDPAVLELAVQCDAVFSGKVLTVDRLPRNNSSSELLLARVEVDIVWKGKTLHLAINPHKDDAWNMVYWFWCCHEAVELMPGMMMSGQDHKQPFTGVVVKQRWWHKLLGITEDQILDKGLVKLKALTEELKQDIARHEAIQEKFGIHKDDGKNSTSGFCRVQERPPSKDPDDAG